MTVYGPLTVGRLTLTEDWQATDKAGTSGRTLSLAGQEASAVLAYSQSATRERAEALLSMAGTVQPVQFTVGTHRDGWYRVSNPQADESTWQEHTSVRWRVDLERVGRASEVEFESRLIGGNRTHASSATAELWHAAPVGADGYYVGSATPGYVDRVSADGTVRVYRGLPAATNPRWSSTPAGYLLGGATITVDGTVRSGLTCADTPASWSLSNGLVKVEPRTSAGTLLVTSYLTSGWGTAKVFDVKRGTTSLGAAQHITLLRNDPCETVLRLTYDHSPGRTTVDLSLKRGARHVAIHTQQYSAASALRVDDNGVTGSVTNQLTASGYIATTADDADANRWILGTPKASAVAGGFGLAASAAATSLPGYIGVIRGGASPAAGDTGPQINSQYLGTPAEAERVIQR